MVEITKTSFVPLDIARNNFLEWTSNALLHLAAKGINHIVQDIPIVEHGLIVITVLR